MVCVSSSEVAGGAVERASVAAGGLVGKDAESGSVAVTTTVTTLSG
jgi:hypothetical protein